MKRILPLFLVAVLSIAMHLGSPAAGCAHILRVSDQDYVTLDTVIEDLEEVPLVFMGELHDNVGHHYAQLQIIHALHERGVPLAIGLEMFRNESQPALNAWISGKISVTEFLPVYYDNWSMWETYREIFQYAKENDIPMVGLNISREITQKVARRGFNSLSSQEVGELPGVRCDVDEKYQAYIRRVLGGAVHGNESFLNFCEAQLLWDTAMAHHLLEYIESHPKRTVVVLAGSGHAWKYGIPEQIRRQAPHLDYRVLLPEIPGRIEKDNVSTEEADYLMLGLDQAPLH